MSGKGLQANPYFENVTATDFAVVEDATRVTRGPVEVAAYRVPGCASWLLPAASRSLEKARWADPAQAEHGILALKRRTRRMKMTKLKTRLGQMAVATLLATGLLVVAQIDSANATFVGKGVHNPKGEAKILTAEPDQTNGTEDTAIKRTSRKGMS